MMGYKEVPGGHSDPECTHVILTEAEYAKLLRQLSDAEQKARITKSEADKEIREAKREADRKGPGSRSEGQPGDRGMEGGPGGRAGGERPPAPPER